MKIRKLNEDGMKEFEQRIMKHLEAGFEGIDMASLLDDNNYTDEIEDDLIIENKDFQNRYELGQYLNILLKDVEMQKYKGNNNAGFWSWIALFLFDDLCKKRKDGLSKPNKSPSHYILSSKYNERYRHAIYSSWELVNLHGKTALFMLRSGPKMQGWGEMAEQMLSKENRKFQEGVIQSASKIYSDTETNENKEGSEGVKPGCVRNFVKYMAQIENNYDLEKIQMKELLEMLPGQFNKYK